MQQSTTELSDMMQSLRQAHDAILRDGAIHSCTDRSVKKCLHWITINTDSSYYDEGELRILDSLVELLDF